MEPHELPGTTKASPAEIALAQAIAEPVSRSNDATLHAMAARPDSGHQPCFGTEAMHIVASALEARGPWMMGNKPRLRADQDRLRPAAEMASAFSSEHLSKRGDALRHEASGS